MEINPNKNSIPNKQALIGKLRYCFQSALTPLGKFLGVFLIFVFIFTQILWAGNPNRKQLEAKRKRMQREIAEQKKMLRSTQKEKSATLSNLTALNQIIQQRQEVINDIASAISSVSKDINNNSVLLDSLTKEYQNQQRKLKKTVLQAYKSRKNGKEIAFVLSARSFSEAMRRWTYLKKISTYRKHQIVTIREQSAQLQAIIAQLEGTKVEKTILLKENESESRELEADKKEKQNLVKELTEREQEIRQKIRQNEAAIAKLNSEINRIIQRELTKTRKSSAKKTASTSKSSTYSANLSAEAKALSGSFAKNRGDLPWPTTGGYISQSFGVHQHPDLEDIQMVNNGVDITAPRGSAVSAVFQGTVSAILNIPTQGIAVIVSHGEYFTVYSRLSMVFIEKGQIIRMGQHIGKLMTDDEGKAVLNFQVWYGQEKQNPQNWLRGR